MEEVHKMAGNLIADLIEDFKSLGTLAEVTQDDLKTLEGLSVNPDELDEGPLASIISPFKKMYRNNHLKLTSDVNGAIEHLKGVSKYSDEIVKWLGDFRVIREHSELMKLFNNPNQEGATFSSQIEGLSRNFDLYVQKVGMSLEKEENLIGESAEIEHMSTYRDKIVKKLEEIKSIQGENNYKDIKEMFIEYATGEIGRRIRDSTSISKVVREVLPQINQLILLAEDEIFKKLNGNFDSYRRGIIRGFFVIFFGDLEKFKEENSNEYLENCLKEINGLETLKYGNFEVNIKDPSRIEYKGKPNEIFKLSSTTLLHSVLISPDGLSLRFKDTNDGKEVTKKISTLNLRTPPPQKM